MSGERFRVTAWPGYPVGPPTVPVQRVVVEGDLLQKRFSAEDDHRVVPDEIRLRELHDLDLRDVEAVADFVSTHGPMTPWSGDLLEDVPMEAAGYVRLFLETAQRLGREPGRDLLDVKRLRDRGVLSVHVDDVTMRIRILRQLTAHARAHAAGDYERDVWPDCRDEAEAWGRFTALANAALRIFHVRVYVDLGNPDYNIGSARPSVYEVAVLQLVNDLTDEVDYRTCLNETCGRVFVRQRGAEGAAFRRTRGVAFCSPSCANQQRQREFRRKKREAQS